MSAAADAIGAWRFDDGLYLSAVPSEIAASAYGLLAMTNLRAVRHKINTANIADLHGAQGKPQRACFRRFPFHVKGGHSA